MGFKSVAVDGPSGAGKSTMARRLAEALGYLYVDTGAIYRTLGLFVRRRGADPGDAGQVSGLLEQADIRLRHGEDGLQHMFLNGEDVTEEIRLPEISRYASTVSAQPEVRAYLLEMQRRLARENNVIMDGRDIGSVVLPHADVKIYLTASSEDRARRRCNELSCRGTPQDYEVVRTEILERDRRDTGRETAPLRQTEDALLIDTTGVSLEESFERLLETVTGRLKL